MELKFDRFERQLASEPLLPVYLIAGSEPLLVIEAADAVRKKARDEGYLEREVLDAEGSFDWQQLTGGIANLSLFASRRLFDLRLPTGKPGKDGSEEIQRYCNNLPSDTVLLITCQDWSKAHAGKWSEAIAKAGHFLPIWPIKPHELDDWCQRRLRSRGLQASQSAIQLLSDRVEGNLLAAAQEIDKLALLSPNAKLEFEDMQRLVADSSRFDVFRLLETALQGDANRVSKILASLKAEGDQVAGLVPMVAMDVVKIATIARVQATGGNVMNAMRDARIWDSKQAMYRRAMDRHNAGRWEIFAAECGRVDRVAKGRESGDAWLLFERLLLAIADAKARALLMT
jgi:DNA polymerase III subunit delta